MERDIQASAINFDVSTIKVELSIDRLQFSAFHLNVFATVNPPEDRDPLRRTLDFILAPCPESYGYNEGGESIVHANKKRSRGSDLAGCCPLVRVRESCLRCVASASGEG